MVVNEVVHVTAKMVRIVVVVLKSNVTPKKIAMTEEHCFLSVVFHDKADIKQVPNYDKELIIKV